MTEPTKEALEATSRVWILLEGYAPTNSDTLATKTKVKAIACILDAFAAQRVAEARARLEDPPEAVIARGVKMLRTPRSGSDETLVHDIWQAMLDEIRALAEPRR